MASFASILEHLREKPEAVRVRYLFFSVAFSFVCVVALWAFSLQAFLGTFLRSDLADAVGSVQEGAQNIRDSAPASLEDLLKTGKSLSESEGKSSANANAVDGTTPKTSSLVPEENEIGSDEPGTDASDDSSPSDDGSDTP